MRLRREPLIVDPVDEPEAAALTGRFLELRRQGVRALVDMAVELGGILLEGRRALQGSYHRWLSERLGIERTTAANYVALAQLGRDSPALIERFRQLGAAKLYRVARLSLEGRHAVLKTASLDEMNDLPCTAPRRRDRVAGRARAPGRPGSDRPR
ncbi:MAG: hypothetical protein EXR72_25780 [Myxococcales bacterium]|nr:hypothetical protein [Myxococcales bacterium]